MDPAEAFFLDRAVYAEPKRLRAVKAQGATLSVKGGRGSAWKHTKTGLRKDLGLVLRSGWEANICRILKSYGIEFVFEPHTFTFPVKRGTRGYTPDLLLTDTNEWLEVKGYFDNASRIKIKRFKKYYPDEFSRMTLIIGKAKNSIDICEALEVPYLFYQDIADAFRARVKNWEGK